MDDINCPVNRRTVLEAIGIGTVGITTAIGTAAASGDEEFPSESLRGLVTDPVASEQIQSVRKQFVEKHTRERTMSEYTFLEADKTFANDRVVAYNILPNEDGAPREQFVTRSGAAKPKTEQASAADVETRLHRKADDLLAAATKRDESTEVSTTASTDDYDIDWESWYSAGSTDVYHEFDESDEYDTRPGAVEFVNDIRRSPDDPRMASRAKLRMEPGRQLCNDGFDEYCTPTYQDGWRNRSATVNQNWDYSVNETPTEDLVVGTDPEGQIDDITRTRTASIVLDISEDPSLSIGYSSSVTLPGAQLVDKTSKKSGRAEHEFSAEASSNSAKNNAVFEVGSVAEFQTGDCYSPPTKQTVLGIDVDLEWGLAFWGSWVNKAADDKSFYYHTYC